MSRAEIRRSMALLRRQYAPQPAPITLAFNVIHVVPWNDPLCGTWSERENNDSVATRSTNFYGRDLAHLHQLIDEYHALEDQEQNALMFRVDEPKGPLNLTDVGPMEREVHQFELI